MGNTQCRHGWKSDQCPYRYDDTAPMGACGRPDRERIDPDCRAGKHRACVGGPCECVCHEHEVDLSEIGELFE